VAGSQASWTTLRDLTARLNALTGNAALADSDSVVLENADAIVTHFEVNDRHGVGKLLLTLFQGDPSLLAIRSATSFAGKHDLTGVSLVIAHADHARDAVFQQTLSALGGHTVRRILCIPYFADDVRTAIALKEIFGATLCTYLMDDQNIHAAGIPDALMSELLEKSRLRLAISPQLRIAYERKYGRPFWYMPPVVRGSLIPSRLCIPATPRQPLQGVVIGNIWGRE
jgi:hypothetical protein